MVGSQVLGTSVTVNSVSLSPLNGSGTIRGLSIENPQGFNSDYAIQLDELSVNLNASSVFSDVVEIESVRVVQPQITYETRITNDNIRAFIANLSSDSTGEAKNGASAAQSEAGKRIIIRRLNLVDPQLNLVAAVVTAPISLPDIELNDIGAEDDSTTVADALQLVVSTLNSAILSANLPNLEDLREGVQDRLQDGVEQVEDAAEELGGRLRSILN
ncbi:MAG: hypothetical protein QGF90_17640 [Gammaproteobacteria bacterium]|mgnify:FL=1|nr:hypothetical protein [Gammaproteobacteria bacterium]|tara:strand:- start:69 stop:716 length:648 start_codon:yes stop_codon:yes gene_type:complete